MMQNNGSEPAISDMNSILTSIQTSIREYGKPVLMPRELRSLYRELTPKNLKSNRIEKLLHDSGFIEPVTLKSTEYSDVERIAVPSLHPSPYDHALSIRGGSYLSHSSAVHLLGLTQQQPKTIYVNREQTQKPKPQGALSQESIDRAFSHPQRRSRYVYRVDHTQIVLLSGKASGRAGVIQDNATGLPITGVARTLIDITVRPRYAGGVFQVAEAFTHALPEIKIGDIATLLARLDYKYPYHQAIGFYLKRAGASEKTLTPLRNLGLKFDFYLDYSMATPEYDDSWRVFFPLGM